MRCAKKVYNKNTKQLPTRKLLSENDVVVWDLKKLSEIVDHYVAV